jgi:hypothetical protein
VSSKNAAAAKPTIGRHAQDRIGRELSVMYAPLLREPLPDMFLMLLRASATAEAAQDRLFKAVLELREANKEFGLSPTTPITMSMSVRTQQVLLAREMLHWSRKTPTPTKTAAHGSRLRPRQKTFRRASR